MKAIEKCGVELIGCDSVIAPNPTSRERIAGLGVRGILY